MHSPTPTAGGAPARRFSTLFLLLGALLCAVGGSCASAAAPAVPGDSALTAAAPTAGAPTLDAAQSAWVKAHPRLRLVYTDAPPYALEREGAVTGFSVEVMEHAAQAVGLKLEWRRLAPADADAALAAGTADALLNAVHTPEREAGLIFGTRTARIEDRLFADPLLTHRADRGPVDLLGRAWNTASFFAVRRDQAPLAAVLDQAIEALDPGLLQSLWGRWFGADDTVAALRAAVRLTEAERADLSARPDLVLGVDADWAPLIVKNADGSFSGIDGDTVALINQVLGTRIRLETGRWVEQVARARRGEIDGLSASAVHPERADLFLFSVSYIEVGKSLFVKAGNPHGLRGAGDLAGRRVAYTRGNLGEEKYLRRIPGLTPVPVESSLDGANRLLSGDVDALLADDLFVFWAMDRDLTGIEAAFVLPDALPLVFSIRKDRPLFVSAIDRVLTAMSREQRLAIKQRYVGRMRAATGQAGAPVLSVGELAYLRRKGGVLTYCFSPVWMPYDYLEGGEHRGTFRDYIALFADELGVEFRALAAPTWPAALRLAEERRCDLISGAVRTAARERSFAFTSPYLNLTLVLVARDEAPFVAGIEQLAGQPIGVPEHTAIAAALRARFPEQPLVELANLGELTAAITSGRVYAAVATLEHAAEALQQGDGRLRIIGKLDDPYPISVAVRNDEPALLAIMQKAVDAVTPAERDRIAQRRTTFHLEQSPDLTRLWQVLGVLALMGLFLAYRHWELTRLNHRLVLARDAAEVASRAKGEFLANMSHEIRTPLNAVLNLAALGLGARDPERVHGYLAGIEQAGRSLLGVVNEVLDFARLEGGAETLNLAPLRLTDLIERVRAIAAPLAAAKGLTLAIELDQQLEGGWSGDAHKLERVLVNLLGNAVKFTDQGGVRLRVDLAGDTGGSEEAPTEAAGAGSARVRVLFAVQDTGIGIGAHQLPGLFEPFDQGDNSLARRHGGTGLGLAIVKHLVALMGGELGVETGPGVGTCFRVLVPLVRVVDEAGTAAALLAAPTGADAGAVGARRRAAAQGDPGRVLVVEDNSVNRQILSEFLAQLGVAVLAVPDGETALAQLAADPAGFSLVLMDIQMPGMDGYETTRRLRRDPRLRPLPVIAITAHVLPADRQRGLEAGMDDQIPKPFDQAQFAATLGRWMALPVPSGSAPAAALPVDAALIDAAPVADQAPAAAPAPAQVWIDAAEGVRRVGGDAHLYLRLLGDFLDLYTPRLAELPADATRVAHMLRGTAPMLGAGPLAALGARIDDRTPAAGPPAPDLVAALGAALGATLAAARALVAGGVGELAGSLAGGLAGASAGAGAAVPGHVPGRVLIVDDDPLAVDLLTHLLADDYALAVAADGARALALARTHPQPDLILLDDATPAPGTRSGTAWRRSIGVCIGPRPRGGTG